MYQSTFSYGFQEMAERDFEGLPEKSEKPVIISIYATEEQKAYMTDQLRIQGSHLNGKAKMLSRIPVSKLQRTLAFGEEATAEIQACEVLFAIQGAPVAPVNLRSWPRPSG